jgi:hypothetical protein
MRIDRRDSADDPYVYFMQIHHHALNYLICNIIMEVHIVIPGLMRINRSNSAADLSVCITAQIHHHELN